LTLHGAGATGPARPKIAAAATPAHGLNRTRRLQHSRTSDMPDFTFTKTCATCGQPFRTKWRKTATCGFACAKLRNSELSRERDKKRRARLRATRLVGERAQGFHMEIPAAT
jgi:hypothetical protein